MLAAAVKRRLGAGERRGSWLIPRRSRWRRAASTATAMLAAATARLALRPWAPLPTASSPAARAADQIIAPIRASAGCARSMSPSTTEAAARTATPSSAAGSSEGATTSFNAMLADVSHPSGAWPAIPSREPAPSVIAPAR